jgi:hypothetical protein
MFGFLTKTICDLNRVLAMFWLEMALKNVKRTSKIKIQCISETGSVSIFRQDVTYSVRPVR